MASIANDPHDHAEFLCPDCIVTFVAKEYMREDGTLFWLDEDGNDCTERVQTKMAEQATGKAGKTGTRNSVITTADFLRFAASRKDLPVKLDFGPVHLL